MNCCNSTLPLLAVLLSCCGNNNQCGCGNNNQCGCGNDAAAAMNGFNNGCNNNCNNGCNSILPLLAVLCMCGGGNNSCGCGNNSCGCGNNNCNL